MALEKVYQRAGRCISWQYYPLARIIQLLQHADLDGVSISPKSRFDESRYLTAVGPALVSTRLVVVVRATDTAKISSPEDLRGRLVGVKLASGAEDRERVMAESAGYTIIEVSDQLQLYRMLDRHRIDAFFLYTLAFETHARGGTVDRSAYRVVPLPRELEFFHALHPKHDAIVPELGAMIAELKESGEIPSTVEEWADATNAE